MPQILRTTLAQDQAQAVAGSPAWDLPVNPLSIILLTVKALNNTTSLANYSSLRELLEMITRATVSYKGASIISGSLTDLAIMYGCLCRWMPAQGNRTENDGNARFITVPLCFGRRPYDPAECFPATRRGDLQLQLETDIATNGLDTLILQIETVELLDARPERFVKCTSTNKITAAATPFEVELPIGNDILGVLLRTDFYPAATDYLNQLGNVALKVDNVESMYSVTNWESLHGELYRKMGPWPQLPHTHAISSSGAAQEEATREQLESDSLLDGYAYMDLDPLGDGQYSLKTEGAARVNLVITSEVSDEANMAAIVAELVALPGANAAG